MDPIEERLANAMTALESTRAAVADADAALRAASETAVSQDRSVEITVGPQGEVTALKFNDGKYRSMAPAQLSAVILETLGQARSRMTRRVVDAYRPISESFPQISGVPGAEIEWDELFGSVIAEGEPRSARRPGSRLRDEIVEDNA
jgi:hypothetical protein